jgi:hypothetical protein
MSVKTVQAVESAAAALESAHHNKRRRLDEVAKECNAECDRAQAAKDALDRQLASERKMRECANCVQLLARIAALEAELAPLKAANTERMAKEAHEAWVQRMNDTCNRDDFSGPGSL